MDAHAYRQTLAQLLDDVRAEDGDGVASDLIDNLAGHLLSAGMRVGHIADRLDNHHRDQHRGA